MKKYHFNVAINAAPQKVWRVLWDEVTYPQWTAAFSEGSRAETDWKKGSKILFLGNSGEGMVSSVAENIPNEFMSIKHLGTIKNGVEDYDNPAAKAWAGAHENYTLKNINGNTELSVDMDITDEYKDYFQTTWPKALEKVKELSEQA